MTYDKHIKSALVGVLFISVSIFALASEPVTINDPVKIEKILSAIPVTDKSMAYKNINERFKNIGLTVSAIQTWRYDRKSELESAEDRIGDEFFQIFTSDPPDFFKQNVCDMLGSPQFLKRGGRYIPQDRTGVWLMTSKCMTPD